LPSHAKSDKMGAAIFNRRILKLRDCKLHHPGKANNKFRKFRQSSIIEDLPDFFSHTVGF